MRASSSSRCLASSCSPGSSMPSSSAARVFSKAWAILARISSLIPPGGGRRFPEPPGGAASGPAWRCGGLPVRQPDRTAAGICPERSFPGKPAVPRQCGPGLPRPLGQPPQLCVFLGKLGKDLPQVDGALVDFTVSMMNSTAITAARGFTSRAGSLWSSLSMGDG